MFVQTWIKVQLATGLLGKLMSGSWWDQFIPLRHRCVSDPKDLRNSDISPEMGENLRFQHALYDKHA